MTSKNLYGFVPDLGASLAGCILFGLITAFQFVLGIMTREYFFWSMWVITAGLEVYGYVCRVISHYNPDNSTACYKGQLISLMIGPVFMAAGLYYQLGVLVTIFGTHYSLMSPKLYTIVFTSLDVVALFMQGAGGGIAAGQSDSSVKVGRWVMVGGIVFQVVVLTTFIGMFTYVNYKIFFTNSEHTWAGAYQRQRKRPLFRFWIPAVYVSLLFLEIRSIYRIVELSEGWNGYLMTTQGYFLVLDGLMIFLGMLALTIVYPGIAYGPISIRHKDLGTVEYDEKEEDESDETKLRGLHVYEYN